MYRRVFNHCPRCATELRHLHTMAACEHCNGRFVTQEVFVGLASDMQPPYSPPLQVLPLWPRVDSPLACPTCTNAMQPVRLGEVLLDLCAAHGLWFDGGEMAYSLMLFSRPGLLPPYSATSQLQPGPPATRFETESPSEGTWLMLESQGAGGRVSRYPCTHARVLLGSASYSAVQIPGAPETAAVIYWMGREPPLLLAEGLRVQVNGEETTRRSLATGDRLTVAGIELKVVYISKPG